MQRGSEPPRPPPRPRLWMAQGYWMLWGVQSATLLSLRDACVVLWRTAVLLRLPGARSTRRACVGMTQPRRESAARGCAWMMTLGAAGEAAAAAKLHARGPWAPDISIPGLPVELWWVIAGALGLQRGWIGPMQSWLTQRGRRGSGSGSGRRWKSQRDQDADACHACAVALWRARYRCPAG